MSCSVWLGEHFYLLLNSPRIFLTLATIIWTLPAVSCALQFIYIIQVTFDLTNTRFKRATGIAYYCRCPRRAGDVMVAGVGLKGKKAARAGSSSEGVIGVIAVTNGARTCSRTNIPQPPSFSFCCRFFCCCPIVPVFLVRASPFLLFFFHLVFAASFFLPLGRFSVACICGEIDWTLLVALLVRFVLYYVRPT
ncbi:unnamed protein product [Ectocarpus sp. 6 AP-2014]